MLKLLALITLTFFANIYAEGFLIKNLAVDDTFQTKNSSKISKLDSSKIDSLIKLIPDSLKTINQNLDTLKSTDTTNTDTVASENFQYINRDGINLRKEANTTSSILHLLRLHDKLEILDSVENWKKVVFVDDITESKITGWVFDKFVSPKSKLKKTFVRKKGNFNLEMPKVKEYPNNPRVDVKGIYITKNIPTHSRFTQLLKFADTSQVNAFVIDVKDDYGDMLFVTEAAKKYAPNANKQRRVKDIAKLMARIKKHNVYPIARIVCFKDPHFVDAHQDRAIVHKTDGRLFQSTDGLKWASAYDRELWNYNIAIAIEAAKAGFREIQFDYVRFPAYSKNDDLDFRNYNNETKEEAIHHFLQQAYDSLSKYEVYVSADVFGLVTSGDGVSGIGQNWEAISSSVDYICPMMYPSHYYSGTYGIQYPDTEPYKVIARGVQDGNRKNARLKYPAIIRPWIQDFTAVWIKNRLKYGPNEIREQARALKDNGVTEYLLWNARNVYSAQGMDK